MKKSFIIKVLNNDIKNRDKEIKHLKAVIEDTQKTIKSIIGLSVEI